MSARSAAARERPAPAAAGLYSESEGQGEPVVLLHGWAMNLRVFDGLRARLAAHHAITAIDLPGHGRSPWPSDWTPARQLDQIGALIPAGATVVGWSLGAQLALELASEPPRMIRRLVLIAATPRFLQDEHWDHGLAPAALQRFAAALEHDAARAVADFLELQLRGSSNAAAARALVQQALERQGMAQLPALRAGLALLAQADWRERARGVQLPALLISGQYDRVTPPAAAQALAARLPCAHLVQLPRAGHAPFLSREREIAAALLQFLS